MLPVTVGVLATMALELETNTYVHVLRREEVSELWGLRNLLERPDYILAFFSVLLCCVFFRCLCPFLWLQPVL